MAAHGVDGLPYGHFGDGCVHVRIDFPLARPAGAVLRAFLEDAAELVAALRRLAVRRARRRPGPRRAAAADVLRRRRSALFARGQGSCSTRTTCSTPACSSTRRRSTPTCGSRRRCRCAAALGFAYPHDGGDFTAAVHRCIGVGKCRADTTAAGGVMCPSYLATRDEKDSTRGRARVLQEMANGSLVTGLATRPRSPRRSTCACPARAARPTARPASTWPPTRPRRCYQRYRRRLRPGVALLARLAAAAGRGPRGAVAAAAGERGRCGSRPSRALAKRLGGIDQRRDLPAFAPQTFRRWFAAADVAAVRRRHRSPAPARAPTPPGAPACCCGSTPSPTPSRRGRAGRGRVLEAAGYEVPRHRTAASAAG